MFIDSTDQFSQFQIFFMFSLTSERSWCPASFPFPTALFVSVPQPYKLQEDVGEGWTVGGPNICPGHQTDSSEFGILSFSSV